MLILSLSFVWFILSFYFLYLFFEGVLFRHSLILSLRRFRDASFVPRSFFLFLYRFVTHAFFQPGFFVSKFSDEASLVVLIRHAGVDESLNVKEYLRGKQFFISIFSWFVFFYVLIYGDLFRMLFYEVVFIFFVIKIPDFVLRFLSFRRSRLISLELSNFMDMLTMSIESGMNFYNAFQFVGLRIQGILGDEIRRVMKRLRFGFPLEDSLRLLPEYLQSDELFRFTVAVRQAKQLGVSLSETLKIQAQMIQNRRRQRAEELSRTAAVKIALPLVFFIFPSLLIIYLGPGILRMFYG